MTPAPIRRVEGRSFGRATHWYERVDDASRVDGTTTLLKNALPTPALIRWASNTTAEQAVDRWDELSQLGVTERLKVLKGAAWEARDKAGLRGTELHAHAERLVHGEPVEVSDEQLPLVESAARFLDDWQVEPVLVERPVWNLRHGWAGTLDLVARIADGRTWILDYKTSKGIYAEVSLQLACYAHAEGWADDDWQAHPLPRIDAGGAVHVRSDGYDLVPVDVSDAAYATFRHATVVARWVMAQERARKHGGGAVGSPLRIEDLEQTA